MLPAPTQSRARRWPEASVTSARSKALASRVPPRCPRDGCAIEHVRHLPANHDRGAVVEVRFACGNVHSTKERLT